MIGSTVLVRADFEPPRDTAVYLDHAATTPVDRRVLEAMSPYWSETFGNPSSMYRLARDARRALDDARDVVSQVLGCRSNEVTFTSGGSESDNAALVGVTTAAGARGHVITTQVEHHAVLNTAGYLEKLGHDVTYLAVDRHGIIDLDSLERAIRPNTCLISVMYANNEIGSVQPIEAIGQLAHRRRVPLHVDGVQAVGALDLNVDRLGVSLMSLSGHKMYGPKGTGVLYIRRGTMCWPFIHGGFQERGRRAGTENVPGYVGFATALTIADSEREARSTHVRTLRDVLINGVLSSVTGSQLTGHPSRRLPNHASFVFAGLSGESLLLALDQRGYMVSTGSACTSGSLEPSHVLLALGLDAKSADGSLRVTLGHNNTADEVRRLLDELPSIVSRLRTSRIDR